jgi:hypothetical protein
MTLPRISPSGPLIDGEELGEDLRYGVVLDSVNTAGGILDDWVPANATTSLSGKTTGVRISLGTAPLVVRGMLLEPGQEIVIRLGRTSTQPLVLLHEDAGALSASRRFNNPNNLPLLLRRGEGVLIRNTEDRNNVQVLAESTPKTLSKIVSLQTASAATTELNASGTITFPALYLQSGMCFGFQSYFQFVHTAAATPLIDFGFSANGGAPSYTAVTPQASAGTFYGYLQGYARVSTPGSAGIWRVELSWKCPFGATDNDRLGGISTLVAADLAAQNTLEMRMRMQSAVASNSLTILNGFGQLIG